MPIPNVDLQTDMVLSDSTEWGILDSAACLPPQLAALLLQWARNLGLGIPCSLQSCIPPGVDGGQIEGDEHQDGQPQQQHTARLPAAVVPRRIRRARAANLLC